MRTAIRTGVLLAAAFLWASPGLCVQITLEGKTFSPNAREIYTPHASEKDIQGNEILKKQMKDKGEDPDNLPPLFVGQTKILKLYADVGQKVQESSVIFEYTLPANIRQFEIERINHGGVENTEHLLLALRTLLHDKREQYEEIRYKFGKGLASQEQLNEVLRTIEALKLKESSLQDVLKADKDELAARAEVAKSKFGANDQDASNFPKTARMYAQNNGYVLWKNSDLKQGATFSKYTRLFRIGDLDPMVAKVWVPEKYLNDLQDNAQVEVTFESLPGRKFTGNISRLAQTLQSKDGKQGDTFVIEVDIPNPDLVIKEGMRATVVLDLPTAQ